MGCTPEAFPLRSATAARSVLMVWFHSGVNSCSNCGGTRCALQQSAIPESRVMGNHLVRPHLAVAQHFIQQLQLFGGLAVG